MYVALWIDDTKDKPNEKVVVCKPMLGRLGTAIAVLNSQRRDDASSMIISGDNDRLQRFVNEVEKVDDRWGKLPTDNLLASLAKLADYCGVSVVPFPEAVEALTRKNPKAGFYPRYINNAAKPIWDLVVEKHKDEIAKQKGNKLNMWAAAIIMFKRYCADRGIPPFTKDPANDQARAKAVNEINRRTNEGQFKAMEKVNEVSRLLMTERLISRLLAPRFYEVSYSRSMFYVTVFQWAKLTKDVKPLTVLQFLLAKGMAGKPGQYAHWNVGLMTDILAEPEGKDVNFYVVTSLTRDHAILMLDLPEDAGNDMILKLLNKAGRQWLDSGVLVEIE